MIDTEWDEGSAMHLGNVENYGEAEANEMRKVMRKAEEVMSQTNIAPEMVKRGYKGEQVPELTCSKCGQEIQAIIEITGRISGYDHAWGFDFRHAKQQGCYARAQPTALVTVSDEGESE